MPRKAKRTAGRWDGKVLPQLEEAERQAWLAIFEAGVELTDPSDKHACAPTLRVAIGPELRLDPLAMYLRSDPTYLRSDPHVPSLGPTPTPMYVRSDPPGPCTFARTPVATPVASGPELRSDPFAIETCDWTTPAWHACVCMHAFARTPCMHRAFCSRAGRCCTRASLLRRW